MTLLMPSQAVVADAGACAPIAEAVAKIPADIRGLLTEEQAVRLAHVIAPARPDHAIAYRVSTRLFGRRIYLAFFTGEELRSSERVTDDGHDRSGSLLLLKITMFCMWWAVTASVIIVSSAVILYLLKSLLGIDLMPGPSPLHHFFFD